MIEFTLEELEAIRDNLVVPEDPKQLMVIHDAYHKIMGAIDDIIRANTVVR